MMHDGMGYGFGFGGPFVWLFWILVIIGVVWAIKGFAGGGESPGKRRSALEILEERYAKGEIDQQEYAEKKRDLAP